MNTPPFSPYDPSRSLNLSCIRSELIRLEDTIIFHLIERAQFPYIKAMYTANGVPLLDWYHQEQEKLQSFLGRWLSPDEYPFYPHVLKEPIIVQPERRPVLFPNAVIVNDQIKRFYLEILPIICRPLFDVEDSGMMYENSGSAATCDISCLQALSRRIHLGKYVAESKFKADAGKYTIAIAGDDRREVSRLITNGAVEHQVLDRIRLKTTTYATDPSVEDSTPKIDVNSVVAMFRDYVIPLTKEVEVEYLMKRA